MEFANQRQIVLKRAAAIAVLFIGAAAARIFWVSQSRMLWGDEPFYLWLGNSLVDSQASSSFGVAGAHFSPLFPLLAGPIAHLAGLFGLTEPQTLTFGSLFIHIVCGGLLVAPVYGIARRMGGEAMAAGAGLSTAFYPAMVGGLPRSDSMIEPLYLLFVISAWYFLLMAVDEGRLWPAALGGCCIGLAYLARTDALPYMILAFGLLLVATWWSRRDRFEMRHAVANAALALVAFAIIIGPYLVAVRNVTGQWQPAEAAGPAYVLEVPTTTGAVDAGS